MHSNAAEVATYLEEAPADRRECLNAIRNICREVLVGYDETWLRTGETARSRSRSRARRTTSPSISSRRCSGCVQKQNARAQYRQRLHPLLIAEEVDLGLVRSMLEATAASGSNIC